MTSLQHARRIAFWRGSGITLAASTAWMLISAYAGHITN